jgi:hypothetical protein
MPDRLLALWREMPRFRLEDLEPRGSWAGHRYFACPFCGGSDHRASISVEAALEMRPLHCHVSGRMGWVDVRQGEYIRGVIRDEESEVFEKIQRWGEFAAKLERSRQTLSAHEAFRLWSEQGCPLEMIEDYCDDPAELHRLAADHSDVSRGNQPRRVY